MENQELQSTNKGISMVYGLVISIILIVIELASYFFKIGYEKWSLYVILIIFLISIIFFCISYSKKNNSNVTFGNIFGNAFKVVAIVTLIMLIWTILSVYLFPSIKEHAIETVRNNMQQQGLDEDKMDKVIEMTKKYFFVGIIGGTLFYFVFTGVIGALIGSLVAKKNNNQTPFQQ